MACNPCLMTWHEFCDSPESDKCCCRKVAPGSNPLRELLDGSSKKPHAKKYEEVDEPMQEDSIQNSLIDVIAELATVDPSEFPTEREYSDSLASGRKRAVNVVKIQDGDPCAWAGLKRAGGGIAPIIGCNPKDERKARAVHHGPDKSTASNDPTNLHKICVFCHNRWHSANDDFYGLRPQDGSPYLPREELLGAMQEHDRVTKATPEELERNEKYWASRKVVKAPRNE